MRTATEFLCDLRDRPGCQHTAGSTFICKVEGREVALCGNCLRWWREHALANPGLEFRCPNCAPQFLANKETRPANAPAPVLLTGPIADLIDQSMYRQGILIDIRRRVLADLYRLANESDGYPSMLLRSTAEAA